MNPRQYTLAVLIAWLAILVLYFAGMMCDLFGPVAGQWLGMIAFLAMCVLFVVAHKRHAGKWRAIAEYRPSILRYRLILWTLMAVCLLAFAVSFVITFWFGTEGVAAGTHPIFDQQAEYFLNNHGTPTRVTRERYLLVGSSFVVGWHSFGILAALFGLHETVFGSLPFRGACK